MPAIIKRHISVELWEVIMQLLNSSFVCVETCTVFVNASRKYLLDEGVECVCVSLCSYLFWCWLDQLCLWCEGKREREKTTEEKNREGDVGLGDFQALCELRKRGGGWGKVRPLLNELGQLAEAIQSVRLAVAPLYRSDPQSCVPQLVSGSTAGVGWDHCIVILRAAGTL